MEIKLKRGIGNSAKSYYSPAGAWGEAEYEQGYFDPIAYVPLYALKAQLPGVEYMFAPIQCVKVL